MKDADATQDVDVIQDVTQDATVDLVDYSAEETVAV